MTSEEEQEVEEKEREEAEENDGEVLTERVKLSMDEDYEIGHTIRTTILPEAIMWYTGELREDDDDEEEDMDEAMYGEDSEGDEEEDEEEVSLSDIILNNEEKEEFSVNRMPICQCLVILYVILCILCIFKYFFFILYEQEEEEAPRRKVKGKVPANKGGKSKSDATGFAAPTAGAGSEQQPECKQN